MPVSRRRKKKDARRPVAPLDAEPRKRVSNAPSPPWFGGLLLAFFVVGIAWLLVYYFSNGAALGMRHLGGFNLVVGFGFIIAGLGMATQWK